MLPLQIKRAPVALAAALLCLWCVQPSFAQPETKKISVVASLFPLYDFARQIAGDKAEVSLLLPPGTEAHSFEPAPADIVRINRADIFIYTGVSMEPWVEDILKGLDNCALLVIDASAGIKLSDGADPHVWLDLSYAQKMAGTILDGFLQKDSVNRPFYLMNAKAYSAKLSALDAAFAQGLAHCAQRTFIHGGHFAFGYLARRYNLMFLSAYSGFAANAEPGPRDLARLTRTMRLHDIKYVYCDRLISPRVASVLAREAGAGVLSLNAAHNLTKEEMEEGATFISIMEKNLAQLRRGLACQ